MRALHMIGRVEPPTNAGVTLRVYLKLEEAVAVLDQVSPESNLAGRILDLMDDVWGMLTAREVEWLNRRQLEPAAGG